MAPHSPRIHGKQLTSAGTSYQLRCGDCGTALDGLGVQVGPDYPSMSEVVAAQDKHREETEGAN